MFDLFQRKPKGQEVSLSISGMHCASCAMNIDGALEDTKGVFSSETSYAKARVKVIYDPEKLSQTQVVNVIKAQGYDVED